MATSAEKYAKGERTLLVLPPQMRFPFGSEGPPPGAEALLEFGYVGCVGETIEWPSGGVFIGVAGLHADGSEDPLPAKPTKVNPPPWPPDRFRP